MKIAFIVNTGGFINFYKFLIPLLIQKGHKIDIVCDISQSKPSNFFYEIGCNIVNLNFSRRPISLKNFRAILAIKKIIKINKYDIVHCHTGITGFLTRISLKKKRNFKVFYTPHGLNFNKGGSLISWLLFYPLEKYLSRKTDVIFTMNKEEDEIAKKNFKAKKIVFTHGVGINYNLYQSDACKINIRHELKLSDKTKIILSIGELTDRKNHISILKALNLIKNQNFVYIIAGKGKNEKKIKKAIRKMHFEKRAFLIGFRSDIPDLIKNSNIFAFPSLLEGLPVSLMEAMAGGLPCVVSNISGNNDLIDDGKGGFLVEKFDLNEYANAISTLLNDDDLCYSMGEYNRKKILKYDYHSVNDELEKEYYYDCRN